MAERRTVTAAVTTYNRASALPRCVAAILNQTDPVDEILIVDDGSTDDTPETVARIREKSPIPLTYIRRQNNGVASSRNTAIEHCGTDFIAFCDDDDLWWQDHIFAFRDACSALRTVNVFAGFTARSSFAGPPIRPAKPYFSSYHEVANTPLLVRNQQPLKKPFFTPSFSTTVVQTSLARKHPLIDELKSREDVAFFWLLSEHSDIFLHTSIHIIAQQFERSLLSNSATASAEEKLTMDLKRSYWSVRMMQLITQGRRRPDCPALFQEYGRALLDHAHNSYLNEMLADSWQSLQESAKHLWTLNQLKLLLRLLLYRRQ